MKKKAHAQKIVTGKDTPLLREKAKKISSITPSIKEMAKKMVTTMKLAQGVGLAAPQIGKSVQIFVVDRLAFDKKLSKWEFKKIPPQDVSRGFTFFNPSIATYPKGVEDMKEGCLSLPGWEGIVTRSKRITIKAQTLEGESFKLQAKGLLAKVLQHEYDHLQGVLICDKWKKAKKVKIERLEKTSDRYALHKEKIVFFGASEYSRIVLSALKKTSFKPHYIITKKEELASLKGTYALGILAFYGGIIPTSLIKRFRYGILNIHPSLLPQYRGPSPVQETILKGDKIAGVSIITLSERVDAGDILAKEEFFLEKKYTTPELHQILFSMGANLLLRVLPQWIEGSLNPQKQKEEEATYTKFLKKRDGLIHWKEPASLIERKIRAYQPWPGAYTFFEHGGKILRVQLLEGEVEENLTSESEGGIIVAMNQELVVDCGSGRLIIKTLRPEGKKQMSGAEFLRGYAQYINFDSPPLADKRIGYFFSP